ncbi:hypothetical protein C4544_05595 [candidate division WS5 bacterium]|uniref:Uncharacterized protein n=1 Tax=candidate division WS5 bacterium TaxID=2093353 RepID=A0A419DAQ9_9BACT|nr:MAG: hypothetical protein C4544_05595 [candidate division WS5 bacterium]
MNEEMSGEHAGPAHEINGTPLSEISYEELRNLDPEHSVRLKDEEEKVYAMLTKFKEKKDIAAAIQRELEKRVESGQTND